MQPIVWGKTNQNKTTSWIEVMRKLGWETNLWKPHSPVSEMVPTEKSSEYLTGLKKKEKKSNLPVSEKDATSRVAW